MVVATPLPAVGSAFPCVGEGGEVGSIDGGDPEHRRPRAVAARLVFGERGEVGRPEVLEPRRAQAPGRVADDARGHEQRVRLRLASVCHEQVHRLEQVGRLQPPEQVLDVDRAQGDARAPREQPERQKGDGARGGGVKTGGLEAQTFADAREGEGTVGGLGILDDARGLGPRQRDLDEARTRSRLRGTHEPDVRRAGGGHRLHAAGRERAAIRVDVGDYGRRLFRGGRRINRRPGYFEQVGAAARRQGQAPSQQRVGRSLAFATVPVSPGGDEARKDLDGRPLRKRHAAVGKDGASRDGRILGKGIAACSARACAARDRGNVGGGGARAAGPVRGRRGALTARALSSLAAAGRPPAQQCRQARHDAFPAARRRR